MRIYSKHWGQSADEDNIDLMETQNRIQKVSFGFAKKLIFSSFRKPWYDIVRYCFCWVFCKKK